MSDGRYEAIRPVPELVAEAGQRAGRNPDAVRVCGSAGAGASDGGRGSRDEAGGHQRGGASGMAGSQGNGIGSPLRARMTRPR